ncbi:hypothetical protein GGI17_003074 [Coemansia sp. S146]|nr:hypothetical protein GGI17_003074 [Coemansia sp. S146]
MKEYISIAFLGAAILTGTLDVRDIISLFLGFLFKDLLDRMYPTTQHTDCVHTARRRTSMAIDRPAPVTYSVGTQVYSPSPPRVVDQGAQADKSQMANTSADIQTDRPGSVAVNVAVQVDESRVAARSACAQTDPPVYDEESEYYSDDESEYYSDDESEYDSDNDNESESDDAFSISSSDESDDTASDESEMTVSRKLPSSAASTGSPTADNKSAATTALTATPASSNKSAASSASTANRQSPVTGTLTANYAVSTSGSKGGIRMSTLDTGVLNAGASLDIVGAIHAGAQDDDITMSTAHTDPHDGDVSMDAVDIVTHNDDVPMSTAETNPCDDDFVMDVVDGPVDKSSNSPDREQATVDMDTGADEYTNFIETTMAATHDGFRSNNFAKNYHDALANKKLVDIYSGGTT